ncbi:alpha/beta hydrolase [Hoyosella sp. YIM 151337]|uniref:alpha/beta fold hydrolase n=1 Tax=Hoyosella sp. YIM 151337 TaxID=2992742 RepID=UPI00223666CA|nr:alpha/beta hydrolase [Hoyosella sp. YIM 151337]MCW4352478.1 alpha/beta hydrolase [Hoyosella sp. YIM 151337]
MSSEPEWFRAAVAAPVDVGYTVSDGVNVAYRAWGPVGAASVVLIHGVAANASWWDHIGPQLARNRRVVAVSLSGHGDSEHRRTYSYEQWARDVFAVVNELHLRSPVLVAHSMGGRVAYELATTVTSFGGVVFVDSGFARPPSEAHKTGFAEMALGSGKVYPDQRKAAAAFQPIGTIEPIAPYLRRHVGLRSVRRGPRGWTWKFDPGVFTALTRPQAVDRALLSPAALLRASRRSVINEETLRAAETLLGPDAVFAVVESGHHVMFDAPLELVGHIEALLAKWS